jgi:ribosomal protein L31E
MSKCKFIDEVAALNIPAKAKAELVMLWHKAQTTAEGIVRFIQRHREFADWTWTSGRQ